MFDPSLANHLVDDSPHVFRYNNSIAADSTITRSLLSVVITGSSTGGYHNRMLGAIPGIIIKFFILSGGKACRNAKIRN